MSGKTGMRKIPDLTTLLVALAIVAPGMSANAVEAGESTPEATQASATPGSIRSRIDLGPIRDLNPILKIIPQRKPEKSEFLYLVEDPAEMLSPVQANLLAEDAHRLTVHGIPTMVVLRESDQTPQQSAAFADQLREQRKIETGAGADDGLLFLVTQTMSSSPHTMSLTISHGARTLPKGGLSEASIESIYERSMRPRLRFGLVSDALKIGIRKMIYLETYLPDPAQPLTPVQSTLNAILKIIAPMFVLAGLASLGMYRLGTRRRTLSTASGTVTRHTVAFLAAGGILVALAILAVIAKSVPGIVAVVVGTGIIAAHGRFYAVSTNQTRATPRYISTRPRAGSHDRWRPGSRTVPRSPDALRLRQGERP